MSFSRNYPTSLKIALATFAGAILLALAYVVFVAPNTANAAGGDLDITLNTGSGFQGGVVYAVAVQQDGKILVGGSFTSYRGVAANGLIRLTPDGERDTTFTGAVSGGGASVRAIALQADGRIIIGGDFVTATTTTRNGIARLTTTGSVDTGFAPTSNGITGIAAGSRILSLAVAYDNKIYAGGQFSQTGSVTYTTNNIARYGTNGTVDLTFGTGNGLISGTNAVVYAVRALPDKRVLIGGDFTNYRGNVATNRMALINENGTQDNTFVSTAITTVYDLEVAPGGKYIVAGGFTGGVARIDLTGLVDTTFNAGSGADNTVLTALVQNDGKVILGGNFQNFSGQPAKQVVRLLPTGARDTSFNVATGVDGAVNSLAIQRDGKVLLGGSFQNFGATIARGLVRVAAEPGTITLNANNYTVREGSSVTITVTRATGTDNAVTARLGITDGTTTPDDYSGPLGSFGKRDPSFAVSPAFTRSIYSLFRMPNGQIVAAGNFYNVDGGQRDFLERFNPDGTRDDALANITLNTGADLSVAVVQPDGKILVGGNFTTINGVGRNRFTRLNSDGSLDTSFATSSASSDVIDIALQSDGKILIAGAFTNYGGRNRIVRLNPDGSVDSTFINGAGPGNGVVRAIALQPDGKIVLGGTFTGYSGRNALVRLNLDGSVDTSFALATVGGSAGPNAQVDKVLVQPDGKIVAVGSFNNYGANSVARFNPDGSEDTLFNTNLKGNSPDNPAKSIALQPDGDLIIGGDFITFNNLNPVTPVLVANRRGIARLNPDGTLDNTFDPGIGITPVGAETDTSIYALLLLPDGKVLAGGNFGGYNGQVVPAFIKINAGLFVSWDAGETGPKTVTFTPADDKILEPAEQLQLTLDFLSGGAIAITPTTATVTILDNDVNLALTSNANPSEFGRTVLTATVTPITATGTVDFSTDNAVSLGTVPLANGLAVLTPTNLAVGSYVITATYSGDANFASNIATITQVITKATPIITITSSPNPSNFQQAATFTVTVNPLAATGIVSVTKGTQEIFVGALDGGTMVFQLSDLPLGSNVISATYLGDNNVNAGSSANYTHTVACSYALTAATDNGSGTACGTLSYALKQAATSNTPVTITLPAALQLTGPLPTVTPTVAVVLDGGCTVGVPGAAIAAGAGAGSTGITLTNNMVLRGAKVTGFSGTALKITGSNNVLSCSWIGTTNGTVADPASTGVGVEVSGSNNSIGEFGNAASGNILRSKGKNGLKLVLGAKGNKIYYTKIYSY